MEELSTPTRSREVKARQGGDPNRGREGLAERLWPCACAERLIRVTICGWEEKRRHFSTRMLRKIWITLVGLYKSFSANTLRVFSL